MRFRFSCSLPILALFLSSLARGPGISQQSAPKAGSDSSNTMLPLTKVPTEGILVKGAWSSTSDSVTPVPEGGNVANDVFSDQYFGMTYALPRIGPRNTKVRLHRTAAAMCWRSSALRTHSKDLLKGVS